MKYFTLYQWLYRLLPNQEVEVWNRNEPNAWAKSEYNPEDLECDFEPRSEEEALAFKPEAFNGVVALNQIGSLKERIQKLEHTVGQLLQRTTCSEKQIQDINLVVDDLKPTTSGPTVQQLLDALKACCARPGYEYYSLRIFKDGSGYILDSNDRDVYTFGSDTDGANIINAINEIYDHAAVRARILPESDEKFPRYFLSGDKESVYVLRSPEEGRRWFLDNRSPQGFLNWTLEDILSREWPARQKPTEISESEARRLGVPV